MKWFRSQCGEREQAALLAAGAVDGAEKRAVENHVAACRECREFFEITISITHSISRCQQEFSRIEPDHGMKSRWTRAIEAAAKAPGIAPTPFSPVRFLRDGWHEMFWSCRRVWLGLAVVWLALLVINGRIMGPNIVETNGNASAIIEAWNDQNRILAELTQPPPPPRVETGVPPRPRTGREPDTRIG